MLSFLNQIRSNQINLKNDLMKTIITKRKYSSLISFIILISLYLLLHLYYQNLFVSTNEKVDKIYDTYWNPNIESAMNIVKIKAEPLFENINNFEWQFGFIIISFSIISFILLTPKCKNLKEKILLFSLFTFFTWLVFAITQSRVDCDTLLNVYTADNYYVSLIFFIPFLYFIYIETIIGIKEDKTEELKIELEITHEDNLKDKLLEMNLISEEVYNNKKEFHIKEKIKVEIQESEEYILLIKSQQKKLITEEEFNEKVESLIIKKYSEKVKTVTE
jgi:hypothetical protein